jgi:glutamine amidotransferase
LGVVGGEVVRFDVPAGYKVPHMGWNQLNIRRRVPLLEGIDEGAFVYFVHSYHAVPSDPAVIVATTDYAKPFVSMIARDRLYATQFHPEKSQAVGLRMLKNFAELG